ncbi:baseplate J/gp47 family protein [Salmonella enterica]|uniref:Baseplate assembly protein n=3 Tax=Salmonella enterica TaxID=28901 RepID=A0A637DVY6_SALET|nr:baseplate J/gp47 family protein [Salmonella enterica]EAA7483535.1 baseplate assembly protein [Salmonella enterica subsp. enterica serovar Irumu]EBF2453394.1 baseplate assembly protein [Salmonella enterica subsp. enterica serovar Poona]ECC8857899.1 baseplate assembly protein [Salmonella enterica subsp. enterica]ECC9579956.1 baseplate assembly protein [Salmonella enterica subsp. houtenae]ECH7874573.1 baseplate assembly protein [Salmonella enterica subsp. enterica serovar Rubislaw]ECS4144167.
MAANHNIIDMSTLPVPDVIQVPDTGAIFSQWLAKLRELDPEFDALVESDPAYKQGEAGAYRAALLMQRVNDSARAVLLASAMKNDLDQLGANFNVRRMVIIPAQPEAIPPVEAVYENDDAFRERIQLSWSQLNTAGAGNSYRFHAKSADTDILDADAYGPETHSRPGEVDVYVLSRTGDGTAGQGLLDKVRNRLNADEVRPLTDCVTVKSATIANYVVTAELEIPDGPDATMVLNNATDILRAYTTLSHRINTLVPLSAIYAALQQPGVARVRLISPVADLEAEPGKAPWCSAIGVTRREAGSNDD